MRLPPGNDALSVLRRGYRAASDELERRAKLTEATDFDGLEVSDVDHAVPELTSAESWKEAVRASRSVREPQGMTLLDDEPEVMGQVLDRPVEHLGDRPGSLSFTIPARPQTSGGEVRNMRAICRRVRSKIASSSSASRA